MAGLSFQASDRLKFDFFNEGPCKIGQVEIRISSNSRRSQGDDEATTSMDSVRGEADDTDQTVVTGAQ